MSESRCEGLPEGNISAEMVDERMRIDTRCGPTAKLLSSTLTNAALKQTKALCRQRHLPFRYRASHSFATLAVSVLSFLHVSFDWPFVVGARRLSRFLWLQVVIDHMATLFFKYVDLMKYVTWFLEFTFWLTLMHANAPDPSGDRREMAMAIARLPCALYAVHQMVFFLPCTVSGSLELLATTVGRLPRGSSSQRHKAGTWTYLMSVCRGAFLTPSVLFSP